MRPLLGRDRRIEDHALDFQLSYFYDTYVSRCGVHAVRVPPRGADIGVWMTIAQTDNPIQASRLGSSQAGIEPNHVYMVEFAIVGSEAKHPYVHEKSISGEVPV